MFLSNTVIIGAIFPKPISLHSLLDTLPYNVEHWDISVAVIKSCNHCLRTFYLDQCHKRQEEELIVSELMSCACGAMSNPFGSPFRYVRTDYESDLKATLENIGFEPHTCQFLSNALFDNDSIVTIKAPEHLSDEITSILNRFGGIRISSETLNHIGAAS